MQAMHCLQFRLSFFLLIELHFPSYFDSGKKKNKKKKIGPHGLELIRHFGTQLAENTQFSLSGKKAHEA